MGGETEMYSLSLSALLVPITRPASVWGVYRNRVAGSRSDNGWGGAGKGGGWSDGERACCCSPPPPPRRRRRVAAAAMGGCVYKRTATHEQACRLGVEAPQQGVGAVNWMSEERAGRIGRPLLSRFPFIFSRERCSTRPCSLLRARTPVTVTCCLRGLACPAAFVVRSSPGS